MTFEPFHCAGGLLFFVGTFCMIASYEEHKTNKKSSERFMYASTASYVIGSILISIG